jgi:hypothetical protein
VVKAGKRVAIYCRVSTKDKGQTTENQRLALEQWAETKCSRPKWRQPHKSVVSAGRGTCCLAPVALRGRLIRRRDPEKVGN